MREEYALDHLITNGVEQANIERLVPNPHKKEKKKIIKKKERSLDDLKKEYGDKAVNNKEDKCRTMRGFNIANSGCKKEILKLENEIENAKIELKDIPDKVPIKVVMKEDEIVRLETERKIFTDSIKMLCYRTETFLFNIVSKYLGRNREEGRTFLKNIFQQPADIIADEEEKKLLIKYHTMSNPRYNNALKELCSTINKMEYKYPGTDMKLIFSASQKEYLK